MAVIDFGYVEKYIGDRGVGFVSRTFSKEGGAGGGHIKTVKRSSPALAEELADNQFFEEEICFWYEIEKTNKGV